MLVLSRKIGQSIIIDGYISVTITAINGDKIRLGIEAPKSVTVHRSEVQDAIRRQAQTDADGDPRREREEGC